VDQHVVLEEVIRRDVGQVEPLQHLGATGHEPILRIEDVPVAGRQLGQKSEGQAAQQPMAWHASERASVDKAVALRVVVVAVDQRVE
jgi:hypothetical protein